jgi:hypothetical protein
LWGFSPPHFGPPQCFALLYGRAKTSYTAGTLCAIIFQKKMRRILAAHKEIDQNGIE